MVDRPVSYEDALAELSHLRARVAALETQAQLQTELLDEAQDALIATDLDGRVLYWSSGAQALYGWSADEMVGQPITRLVGPESAALVRQRIADALQAGTWRTELVVPGADDVPCYILSRGKVVCDAAGQPCALVGVDRDVSALTQTQQAYQTLLEYSLQGVAIFQDGRLVFCNSEVADLLGYTLPDLYAMPPDAIAALIHADDRAVLLAALAAEGDEPPTVRQEARVRLPGRAYRWFLFYAHGTEFRGRRAVQVTFTDIHDLKTAEKRLRAREELFRRTFDQSPVGAAVVNRTLHFVRVNAALCSITGYTPADLRARTVLDITHPYDRDTARELWEQLVAGDLDYFTMEQRYVRQDGATVWINLSVRMLEDRDGQKRFALPMMENITGRKRAEAELRRNEQKYRSLIEQSADGVWLFDAAGRNLEWNQAAEQLTGLARAWVLDRTIGDVMAALGIEASVFQPPEPDEHAGLAVLDRLPPDHMLTLHIRRADGALRHLQVVVFPIMGDEGLLVGNVIRDTTERLRDEEHQLRWRLEKERVAMLTDFIRDASHEFRTPLSLINSHLYMLRRTLHDPEHAARVEMVGSQVRYLHELLEAMLTVTRLDSKQDWVLSDIPVAQLLDTLHTRIQPLADERALSFSIHAPDNTLQICCDEVELYQALLNIVVNALHFTPAPGAVMLRVSATPEHIAFVIVDTGVGIPPEALPHIFERFYRVDTARTQRGAGLGLVIARKIIEAHQGTITVESAVGQGSTFCVTLPRQRQE